MSSPPAKTVNTVLQAAHDFAIARILNTGFLKVSHYGLPKLKRLGRLNPLNLFLRNMQRKGDKRKQEEPHTRGFTGLNGIWAKFPSIRLCRTSQKAPPSCRYTREKTKSLNTARAETICQNYKTWAAFTPFNIRKDTCWLHLKYPDLD